MSEPIALLVDSGVNLPADILSLKGVYQVPLTIIYGEQIYEDNVSITSSEIYRRLDAESPTTSLPSGQAIHDVISKIIDDGYKNVLVITISSRLSGTYQSIKLAFDEQPSLTVGFIDTKNAAIGAGMQAAYAKELIDHGHSLADILLTLEKNVSNTVIYISLPTLEYLKRGGRISSLSSFIGSSLNIHPIISCDPDGLIFVPAKSRGRSKSIKKMIQLGEEFIDSADSYDIAIVYTNCPDDAISLSNTIKQVFPNYRKLHFSQASPVLGIHTGPDAVGLAIMKLP